MHKEENTLSNTCTAYNVQNVLVSKNKTSDFLRFLLKNKVLEDCSVRRFILSGNYYIITYDITSSEQRDLFKDHLNEWV